MEELLARLPVFWKSDVGGWKDMMPMSGMSLKDVNMGKEGNREATGKASAFRGNSISTTAIVGARSHDRVAHS